MNTPCIISISNYKCLGMVIGFITHQLQVKVDFGNSLQLVSKNLVLDWHPGSSKGEFRLGVGGSTVNQDAFREIS